MPYLSLSKGSLYSDLVTIYLISTYMYITHIKSMNKIFNTPHLIFWSTVPIIIIIGLSFRDSTLDINIHDTYFVTSQLYISYLISIFFGVLGLGYWILITCKRKLIKELSILHIISTLGGVLGILISPLVFKDITMKIEILNLTLTILVMILILGQVFYLLQICIALFRKGNKTNQM